MKIKELKNKKLKEESSYYYKGILSSKITLRMQWYNKIADRQKVKNFKKDMPGIDIGDFWGNR